MRSGSYRTHKTNTHLDQIVPKFVVIVLTFERDLRTHRWPAEVASVLVRGPERVGSSRIAVAYGEVVAFPEDAAAHKLVDHSSSLGISEFWIPERGLVYLDHFGAQIRRYSVPVDR